jgi:tyrosine-protein kinase Etk/Wzc
MMEQPLNKSSEDRMRYEDHELDLRMMWSSVTRSWRLLLVGPALAGALAAGVTSFITPTFTAMTSIFPPQAQQSAASAMLQSLGALGGLAGAAAGLKNPGDQYVAFLKSRSLSDALIKRFDLGKRYGAKDAQGARSLLAARTRIVNGKDGLITLEFDDPTPVFAAEVANAYIDEMGKLLDRLAVTESQQRRLFFEKQLERTKSQLVDAERKLKASGVNVSALKTEPASALVTVAQLQAQIMAAEVQLSRMRSFLTDSAPEYKAAQSQLTALRAQVAKVAAPSQIGTEDSADYIAHYRDVKYYGTLFEIFAKQLEMAKVDEAKEGASVQVLDIAQPPERKSKPQRSLISVITAFATGCVLLVFVLVRDRMFGAKSPQV